MFEAMKTSFEESFDTSWPVKSKKQNKYFIVIVMKSDIKNRTEDPKAQRSKKMTNK